MEYRMSFDLAFLSKTMKPLKDSKKIKVEDGKNFKLSHFPSNEPLHYKDETSIKKALSDYRETISDLQEKLYASGKHSVLIILQAIDAAGKDSCIKHVMSGVNPQGCSVSSFKSPSKEELSHDFLWRTYKQLPERGKIGVFNRSYYEEVLICKVHPEYVLSQNIPGIEETKDIDEKFWKNRYRAINEMERHYFIELLEVVQHDRRYIIRTTDRANNSFLKHLANLNMANSVILYRYEKKTG